MTSRLSPSARVYLDHNATAPMLPRVRAAMAKALDLIGNASSIHAEGRAARAAVETAREQVAQCLGRSARSVIFTSGGTEGAAAALSGGLRDRDGSVCDVLIASAGEHACVLSGHGFPPDRFETAALRADGRVDLDALAEALRARPAGRVMVALQAANNETGVIQPVEEVAALVRERGGVLICDAVQAVGRLDCAQLARSADVLILSAHKIGGPKGVGALVIDDDRLHMERALVRGGGQERGWRAGTENVPAIVGFGALCADLSESAVALERDRLSGLRDGLEAGLRRFVPEVVMFGADVERLANTSAFAVEGETAEMLMIALDLAGVAASSGSACSSGKVGRSHVLAAMGVTPGLARAALRVSLGWSSGAQDVEVFCETFEKTVRSMRSRRAGRAA